MPTGGRPDVIFLGAAERASLVHDLGTSVLKWNFLGVNNVVLVNFLPLNFAGLSWIFAIRFHDLETPFKIRFADNDGNEVGSIKVETGTADISDPLTQRIGESRALTLMLPLGGYTVAAFNFGQVAVIAQKPGRYRVLMSAAEIEELVGEFEIAVIDPAPLTPERIAAIKSDPSAAKAARAEIGCKHCATKLHIYAALEQSQKIESEGYTWYANISDWFQCGCGKTEIDLTSIKRNFFAILGHRMIPTEGASFEPLYQSATLDNIRVELLKLIEKNPREEAVQQFIQDNPILLHQFPSEKIFLNRQF